MLASGETEDFWFVQIDKWLPIKMVSLAVYLVICESNQLKDSVFYHFHCVSLGNLASDQFLNSIFSSLTSK